MPVSTECAAALLSFRYPSNNNKIDMMSPSHSYFSFGIICGRLWGSLAVEGHLRSWDSFTVLYSIVAPFSGILRNGPTW